MSGIAIRMKAGATKDESRVDYSGELVHIITDSERASFGIGGDADLKRAVGKYFGKEPEDAWLHRSDLYKMYGFEEVQTVLKVKEAEIMNVTTKPDILATSTMRNDSNYKATFPANIHKTVSNTVSSGWTNSNSITVGQSIKYGIEFLGTGGGGQTSFDYSHTWGKNESKSEQTTVGFQAGATVELGPKESAIVELSVDSGTMRVRITYEAYLKGVAAVNYSSKYKNNHLHDIPIENLLSSPNKVQTIEDVEVDFYSNATVTVKNAETNHKMQVRMA